MIVPSYEVVANFHSHRIVDLIYMLGVFLCDNDVNRNNRAEVEQD